MRKFWNILFFCCTVLGYSQIAVDTTSYTVEQLVRDILVNSNCAETSNYSSSTGIAQGVDGIGYFSNNGSRFQYEEGIVLSTGYASDSEGPNDEQFSTTPTAWTGDTDLTSITGTGVLFNASYIQFDFVPRTNSISFNFLFASEEYDLDYQCIYSDVFAFILTGPDGVSTNLALIPDTEDPVSATSIRPGIPGSCEPSNVDYFFGINGDSSPISQHGQTISLTARSAVVPLATYTIKLVIADNLDSELDSAVYLEAGSFSIDVSLGDNRTVIGGNPLCDGEVVNLNALSQGAQDYIWYRDGVELAAERNQPAITVIDDGVYAVEVVFSANCVSNGEITLEYIVPPIVAEEPLNLIGCDIDGDGIEVFDFSSNTERILGNQDPSTYRVYYFRTFEDAENFENQISRSTAYPSETSNQQIFARISSGESCYEITSFELIIQSVNFTSELEELYTLCLDEFGNPIAPFPILDTGFTLDFYGFQWYRDSVQDENLIVGATAPALEVTDEGRYVVMVQILEFGCEVPISTMVNTSSPPESVEVNQVSELFAANTIVEILVEGASEYLYSVDGGPTQEGNRFTGLGPGQHTATVVDIFGCNAVSEDFFIVDYPRFFTPNADGTNDTWTIIGINEIESPEISIYDRYGKLLYQFLDLGWDGMYNGQPLPSSDYWFRISYALNGGRKEFKGHFSLKR